MTVRGLSFACLMVALCVAAPSVDAQRTRGDRSKITRTDLDEAGETVSTAQDAVRLLRPHWLQPTRGKMAVSNVDPYSAGPGHIALEVVVYIDEVRQPSVEALRTVQATSLVEMKYLDQNRAVQMLGPGHESGAIQVTTVNKRK